MRKLPNTFREKGPINPYLDRGTVGSMVNNQLDQAGVTTSILDGGSGVGSVGKSNHFLTD
jgi:hypothetical protein